MKYTITMKTIRNLDSEETFEAWLSNQKLIWAQAGFNSENLEKQLKSQDRVKFSGTGVRTMISMECDLRKN